MTELYRYFDKAGVLLYVGISFSTVARAAQHRGTSHWWHAVDKVTVQRFDSRENALHAERKAIIDEKPLHNVVHNYDQPPPPEMSRAQFHDAITFDAYFQVHRTEWHQAAAALLALSRVAGHAAVVDLAGGLTRSLIYADHCEQCNTIHPPYAAELDGPTSIGCSYVCLPCQRRWIRSWPIDPAVTQ